MLPASEAPLWGGAQPAPAPSPTDGARYTILGELARGGLGRILSAYDRVLGRPVAIKELLRDLPGHRARFRNEIRLTARLQHPVIVPLYDAVPGADGVERYTMKLVSGVTLADAVAAAPTLEARLVLLPHVLAVADAVAYAHAQGVVHRDIKPQNILVGTYGETVLIDWGVAKALDTADPDAPDAGEGGANLTRVGAIVGTPAYMPPEQARGEPADPRFDVYAVGATLYHVLAGAPPYSGEARTTLDALRAGDPAEALEARVPGVPADLLSIVHTAMATDPARRYPSGAALRADLQRFMTGQLVAARTYTPADLARRWIGRNRRILAVIATAAALLLATGVVSASRVIEERNVAEARSNTLTLVQAMRGLDVDPTEAASWLAGYPADGAEWDRVFGLVQEIEARGPAWRVTPPPFDGCTGLTFTPDGRHVLPSGLRVEPMDTSTGARRGFLALGQILAITPVDPTRSLALDSLGNLAWIELPPAPADATTRPITRVAAAPSAMATDATTAVIGDRLGGIVAVDLASGTVRVLHQGTARVTAVTLLGDRWFGAAADGSVWTGVVAGGEARLLARRATTIEGLVGLGGGAVAVGDAGGDVTRIDLDGTTRPLLHLPAPVATLVVGDQGRLLVAADTGTGVGVLDLIDGHAATPPWTPTLAVGAAVAPGAPLVALTLGDGSLRVWRPFSGTSTRRIGRASVYGPPAFSPDGATLATCAVDGEIRLWPTPALAGTVFRGHTGRTFHPTFLPDGRLATDSEDGSVRIWTPGDMAGVALVGHTDGVYGLEANGDNRRLLSVSHDGTARIWDLVTRDATVLRGHVGRVTRALWLPGERVLTAGRDGTLRTWAADGTPMRSVVAHAGGVSWAALTAGGDHVYTTGADHALRRWNVDDGTLDTMVPALGGPLGVAVRPYVLTGDRVLACGDPGALLVVTPGAAPVRTALDVNLDCPSMAVAPDGHQVLVPYEKAFGIFDADTGGWQPFGEGKDDMQAVAWSPDGTLVATADLGGAARIWRVADGAAYIAWRTEAPMLGVAFSPDGASLGATSADTTAWLGPVDPARFVPHERAALAARVAGLTTAQLAVW